jgi:hypothetical protein
MGELRNMMSSLEYLSITKTLVKYASYYVDIESSLIFTEHQTLLAIHYKEEPDIPLTFYGSVFRFMIIVAIIEAAKRFPFTSQKQINVGALIMFNLFSLIVFVAIG